jgi:hypothetical protein
VPVTYNTPQGYILMNPTTSLSVRVSGGEQASDLTPFQVGAVVAWRRAPASESSTSDVSRPSGIAVVSITPDRVSLDVDRETKRLRVVPDPRGEPAAGAVEGQHTAEPEYVTVKGPQSSLESRDTIFAPVSIGGRAHSFEQSVTLDTADPLVQVLGSSTVRVSVVLEPPSLQSNLPSARPRREASPLPAAEFFRATAVTARSESKRTTASLHELDLGANGIRGSFGTADRSPTITRVGWALGQTLRGRSDRALVALGGDTRDSTRRSRAGWSAACSPPGPRVANAGVVPRRRWRRWCVSSAPRVGCRSPPATPVARQRRPLFGAGRWSQEGRRLEGRLREAPKLTTPPEGTSTPDPALGSGTGRLLRALPAPGRSPASISPSTPPTAPASPGPRRLFGQPALASIVFTISP